MKKACSVLLVLLFALPLLRCTQDETNPVPETDGTAGSRFSLTEACGHYMQSMRMRSAQSGPDTATILPVGHFVPVWDAAAFSENDYLASYDVPVQGQYRYTLLARTDDGGTYPIELLYRLVSIKTPEGNLDEYLLFFMPDRAYDLRNRGERSWEGVLNSGDMQDFTGLLFYTTLDGVPACAARFRDGQRTAAAYIGDTTRTLAQNVERLSEILGTLTIRVESRPEGLHPQPGRMGGDEPKDAADKDTITWHFPIDGVVCVGKPKDYRSIFLWYDSAGGGRGENPRPPADPPYTPPGGGIGGGNGDTDSDAGESEPGDRIKSDQPKVDSLVNKLLEDCMGQVLLDLLESDITVLTDDPACGNSYDPVSHTVYFDAWNKDHAMIVLIEELTHAYQFQQEGTAGYISHGLNNEIEAKMGWYIYTIRNNMDLDLRKYLGGWTGIYAFSTLHGYYSAHYFNNLSFDETYNAVVQIFRSNPIYSNANKYKESSSHRTFDHLDELMANCLE